MLCLRPCLPSLVPSQHSVFARIEYVSGKGDDTCNDVSVVRYGYSNHVLCSHDVIILVLVEY